MRTHVLLYLVLAIVSSSGCTFDHGFRSQRVQEECAPGDAFEASEWTGVEPDYPRNARTSRRTTDRFAFLNPFRRGRSNRFQYEGEVVELSGCSTCGTEGNFSGNGQCDECLQGTVAQALDNRPRQGFKFVQEPDVLAQDGSPLTATAPAVPEAPNMDLISPRKVVEPHAALSQHSRRVEAHAESKPDRVEAIQEDAIVKPIFDESDRISSPEVPTTIMDDRRIAPSESSPGSGSGGNSRAARIVNKFNNDVDWSELQRPKSIALSPSEKTGVDPVVKFKTYGKKGRVIEFVQPSKVAVEEIPPPRTRSTRNGVSKESNVVVPQSESTDTADQSNQVKAVNAPLENPKFEQFSLDDLFPDEPETPAVEQPKHESPLPLVESEPLPGPAVKQQANRPNPSQAVAEEEKIEWSLPNKLPTRSKKPNRAEGSKGKSDWEVDDSDWERGPSESEPESDWQKLNEDSLLEDENGEFDSDADFSAPRAYKRDARDRLSQRTEQDIIEELRNSTVPNRVVFDNSPEIPEKPKQRKKKAKPVVLSARPVPHYRELRHLAKMDEDGVVDVSGDEITIEKLPDVRKKVPAIPVSSSRVVQEVERFDFQPLPNLMLSPAPKWDDGRTDDWRDQAFDPETILEGIIPSVEPDGKTDERKESEVESEVIKPAAAKQNVENTVTEKAKAAKNVNETPKQSAVPIVLRAAPTFGNNADNDDSAAGSKARIRFIKPSYQRDIEK